MEVHIEEGTLVGRLLREVDSINEEVFKEDHWQGENDV